MGASDSAERFEQVVMPHLDAAYNLARWLAGNDHDAKDIAQEACLRAFRFLGGFRGENSRAWLLTIVRHTAYTWLKQNRPKTVISVTGDDLAEIEDPSSLGAAATILSRADAGMVRAGLEALPAEFREVLILREIEGLSYKEIAAIAETPIGTVMSRLARGRKLLQQHLNRNERQP